MDCLEFLEQAPSAELLPIYVLAGDQDFLKREARCLLRAAVLGDNNDPFALATFPGDKATYAEVIDTVSTRSFFTPRRLVVVLDADPFVTEYREKLERYIAKPSSAGILVLEVRTWTSTTRLAKTLVANTIHCKSPGKGRLPDWCVAWSSHRYGKQLAVTGARALVELIGENMGQLDMELNKLSTYVGERTRITAEDVQALVNDSREQSIWPIFDRIGEGDAAGALRLLDHVLAQGGEFFLLLGAMALTMRRLAQAGRLSLQGVSLPTALERAGVPPFARRGAEQQLRHLGRTRINRLYEWILEAQMLARTTDGPPQELILERLVVRLARKS